jgi:hypothetical protein
VVVLYEKGASNMQIAGKLSSAVIKALTGAGKRTKAANTTITKAAKKADMPRATFIKEARKKIKKDKKAPSKIRPTAPPLAAGTIELVERGGRQLPAATTQRQMEQVAANIPGRRGAAIRRLTRQQEGEALEGMGAPVEQRRVSRTYPPTDPRNVGEGVNTALLSKAEVEPNPRKYSRARLRQLIEAGTVKLVRRGTNPDGSPQYIVVSTGRFAPPRGMVAEEMGLKGALPSEEELVEAGGFQIRKRGGIVRRSAGGAIGIGAALRGFGKGYKKRGGNAF